MLFVLYIVDTLTGKDKGISQSSNPANLGTEQLHPLFIVPQTWPALWCRRRPGSQDLMIFRQREFSVGCCQE
ncbi:hypothetical protein KVR01_011856 [Diaporthe batatas]|uniref:uncharacterized protein n=1 Tax=Diaporthe batatas TaxID=748121 RepID=UPI001D058900|nr:uncharacterized protein KVR01_011856 [Diaporthe batatas]KAG8158095.1 hypothetical protein KVR01_011856 [Diaporthe batatas]